MEEAIKNIDHLYDEGWISDAEYNRRLDELIAEYDQYINTKVRVETE